MGDLTNTNQNDNSKIIDSFNNPDNFDTYKTMSECRVQFLLHRHYL